MHQEHQLFEFVLDSGFQPPVTKQLVLKGISEISLTVEPLYHHLNANILPQTKLISISDLNFNIGAMYFNIRNVLNLIST